ncbi:hypothetical protein [Actinotalea sp. JY-7876]|uniref:hypothetical protein n=1 Tax=Actinotalea sp. JY-7876 TaxID=2758442 RepID=UPI0015F70035|nr:hypothetical protein [Actinotalea sp. JY-7876]
MTAVVERSGPPVAPAEGVGLSRAALARAALARAEERTGARGWVRPVRGPRPAETLVAAASPDAPLTVPGHAPEPADDDSEAAERLLPVRPELAPLLPLGALGRGSTVVVTGSTSLVLGLVAEASRAGGWVAVVGLPGMGVLAAHELGVALDRVVLVPDPGADGPTVVAALLDGVDVVVVGPQTALSDGDRRRLTARARERSAVLLPTTPWPGAHVVLTARTAAWEGLGHGHGRLRSRQLVVERQGRGSAARPVRAQVSLPAGARPWEPAAEPAGAQVAGQGVVHAVPAPPVRRAG